MAHLTDVSQPKARIIENFIVVWLDPQVDEFQDDYEKSIIHLRSIVNSIKTFNDTTPVTIITENSLNELDQSFMYSQLLKEILLEMTYDNNSKIELIEFCRLQYEKNQSELNIIKEFEKYYPKKNKVYYYNKNLY